MDRLSRDVCRITTQGYPARKEDMNNTTELAEGSGTPPCSASSIAYWGVAIEPFSLDGSGFVVDASGSRVLACYDDDADCSRRYAEDVVDTDGHFICACGRLGQRMEEVDSQRCGL